MTERQFSELVRNLDAIKDRLDMVYWSVCALIGVVIGLAIGIFIGHAA